MPQCVSSGRKPESNFYSGQEPAAQCLLCSQRGKPPLLFCSNGISNKNLGLGGIRIKSSLKKIFLPVIPDICQFLCRQNFNLNQTDFSPTLKYQQEGPQYFFCYLIFSMPGAVQQCMCTPMLIVYTSACLLALDYQLCVHRARMGAQSSPGRVLGNLAPRDKIS